MAKTRICIEIDNHLLMGILASAEARNQSLDQYFSDLATQDELIEI